jgi:hypothetical protein
MSIRGGMKNMDTKRITVLMILSVFFVSMLSFGIAADSHSDGLDGEDRAHSEARNTERDKIMDVRSHAREVLEEHTESAREKLGDVKVRQRAHFGDLKEKCKDNERCKDNLRIRQEMVDKLDDKKLDVLEHFQEKRKDASQKLEELKKHKHFEKFTEEAKARMINSEDKEQAEQRYKEHKEKYTAAKQRQREHREKFNVAREEWREKCNDESDTDECTRIHRDLAGNAIKHLKNTLERIENHILKFEDKVHSHDGLSEEESDDILARIERMKANVAEVQDDVNKLTEDSSKEEIKEATTAVREMWSVVKHELRIETGNMVNARVGGFLVKAEHMSVRLAKLLERLTESDVDTVEVERLVDEYNNQHELAKQQYAVAADLFKQARTLRGEEKAAQIHEAEDAMKEAKELLRQAHNTLKEIHELLRELKHLDTLQGLDADSEE